MLSYCSSGGRALLTVNGKLVVLTNMSAQAAVVAVIESAKRLVYFCNCDISESRWPGLLYIYFKNLCIYLSKYYYLLFWSHLSTSRDETYLNDLLG